MTTSSFQHSYFGLVVLVEFDSVRVILVGYLVVRVVIDNFVVVVVWAQQQKQVGILMPNQDPL